MLRSSFSTDFSQSNLSVDNFPLPIDKSLVIDRRLDNNTSNHATHTPTNRDQDSLSSDPGNGKGPGPPLPPSPADSTMAASSPVGGASRSRRYSVGEAIGTGGGDATGDKDGSAGMRTLDRGAPGDRGIISDTKSPSQRELARRKSQYYKDVFAQREPTTSARERVARESFVIADVRTNVIIQDEYSFITDLSHTLSSRYARPENSICVSVTHTACLLFAGSFEPAYTMTITALPSLVQPTTNKRNAALIQKSMEDLLGVSPQRGLLRFVAVNEENLATNGRTTLGEIEEMERESKEEIHSPISRNGHGPAKVNDVKRIASKKEGASAKIRRSSIKNLRNLKTSGKIADKGDVQGEDMTPPLSGITETSATPGTPPPAAVNGNDASLHTGGDSDAANNNYGVKMPGLPTEKSDLDRKAAKAQKLGKRKSFIAAVFGKA